MTAASFESRGDLRVAERQAGGSEARDQLQIGQVELHLSIEPADRGVEVIAVAGAVVGERPEHVRVQLGDTVEDLRFHVVHLGVVTPLHQVAVHRSLLELGEGLLHLGAVVRLALVGGDRDLRPVDPNRVAHPAQRVLQGVRLCHQRGEVLGRRVLREVLAQPPQTARAHVVSRQVVGERPDGVVVDPDGVQEPRLLLERVIELLHRGEVLPHPPHRFREGRDRLQHLALLEIAQHLVAVVDGRDLVQLRVEVRPQLVFLATSGHRLQDLIEIQVDEGIRLLEPVDGRRPFRPLEEDAPKPRDIPPRARVPTRSHAVRRERRARSRHVRSRHQLPPVRAR